MVMVLLQASPIQKIPIDLPAIIREASKTPLGILALMLLIVGGIGYVFFKNDSTKARAAVFLICFLGVLGYAIAVTRTTAAIYRIAGQVVDSSTGNPIEAATVKLEWGPPIQQEDTDSEGYYNFVVRQESDAIPDRIILMVNKDEYQRYRRTVSNPFLNMPQDLKMHKAQSLKLHVCDQLPTLKSEVDDKKAQIAFTNRTDSLLQAYWVDYTAHEQYWFELPPNEKVMQDTYVGHPWVIRNLKGECLAIYVPTTTGTVTNADIH
jgi:hypothetical protein